MKEHTPGPWTVIPGVYDTNPETAMEFPHGPEIVAAGRTHIASLNMFAEEDANLIAAAPELLEALKEMVSVYWDGGDGHDPTPACIQRAKTVLAKAEGIR